MADLCKIGPVSIEDAHLFDESTYTFSNGASRVVTPGSTIITKGSFNDEYGFGIIMPFYQAIQVKGLVEAGELVWMDTSSDLTDNNFFQHKGWVILTELQVEEISPRLAQCNIKYVKISDYQNEYLTMDYSRGIYDGINLTPTYNITQTVYQLQEDGSDITTNWTASEKYPSTTVATAVTDGAEFDLTTRSAVDGAYATAWIRCFTKKFTPPFTLETILDRNSLPGAGAYPANIRVMFTPNYVGSGDKEYNNKKLGDYLEFSWNLSPTTANLHLAELGPSTGTYGTLKWLFQSANIGVASAELGLKMEFTADGNVRLYTDYGLSGTYTQLYYGPSNLINSRNGLWLYLEVANRDSTNFTGSFQKVEVYNGDSVAFPNIVHVPYNATLSTTATGTRAGSDGNISYYTNPTTELRFLEAEADYYKGSVKLLSTNNSATTSRQVFSTESKLTPTTTTLQNAFTQLTFDADEVIIKGYDGGWQDINKIHYTDDIDLIRPLFINSERIVLQINDTKWTMLRSSPIVTVEHPNTILGYTLRDRYVTGSGTTSAPAADAAIAMTADTDYYMKIHDNAADSYSLVIGKKDPVTIRSDSLPVDSMTGIGWFKKAASGINAADSLIQQWYKQTRTGISLKQII